VSAHKSNGWRVAVLDNTALVGTVTILVLSLAVYLSYIAVNGLPFVSTYRVNVEVANADELAKNADVRIGGARVGQVLAIVPEPASPTWPHPYARLTLALDPRLGPLPPDTRYRVRLSSVLGGKYLELIPGHLRIGRIPDGGTLTLNVDPRRNHELPFVDLDTALETFGPATARPLRAAIGSYGDLVAGRGSAVNDSLYALGRLLPPLQRLLAVVAAPGSRLAELVRGAAQTARALAPVAPALTDLIVNAATTFEALTASRLGAAIDQTPPTETVATGVLTRSLPVLTQAATILASLRPAAPLLGPAARGLDEVILAGTPIWAPVPRLAADLRAALAAVRALARDPSSREVFSQLGANDLATVGASAFVGLGAVLRAVAPAQFACNVAPLWLRNFSSALTEGDSTGAWLRSMPLLDPNQSTQAATPAPDLHLDYYPIEDAAQCQAANEPYTGKQLIGNPSRTSNRVDDTSPPPGVLAEGRKAGLVP
jgi:virulence factor Mce-like protein